LIARLTIPLLLFIIAGTIVVNSCRKSGGGRKAPTPLSLKIPEGFPNPAYNFGSNPLTEEGFQLGRKLFYEGLLSKDGNFPCSSCHQQFAAFANFDHDLSHGFNNQFTTRNSPGLFNLAWHKELHWDGGINHIEVQALAPITAPNEMAEDINNVIRKLQNHPQYPGLFAAAFGDEQINSQRILLALTQFVGSILSYNSKYDKVKRGEAAFNDAEKNGYAIFQAKCSACHAEPLFTDLSFRNTGIPLNPFIKDVGRMRITNKKEDSLKFKVPSLRNLFLTFPYGHDGSFVAVRSMLNHYSDGVQTDPNVDPLVKNKIPLSNLEKFYLEEFLKTLTDSTLINDKRFSQPE
jgi:cytochrome c peroxidase